MPTGFSELAAATIRDRSMGRCEICGSGNPVHIHHRTPRRSGGTKGVRADRVNSVPNGLRVCNWCHDRAEKNRTEAFHMGWLVPEGVEPSEYQVYLNIWMGQGWYRLDVHGCYSHAEPRAA
jgi:hypothetical protein